MLTRLTEWRDSLPIAQHPVGKVFQKGAFLSFCKWRVIAQINFTLNVASVDEQVAAGFIQRDAVSWYLLMPVAVQGAQHGAKQRTCRQISDRFFGL